MNNLFWIQGLEYTNHSSCGSRIVGLRKFRSFFGCSPEVCEKLWNNLRDKPGDSSPKHLLWALLFLKCYNIGSVNASLVNVDEKTFRKWSWCFIELLSQLDLVNL